MKVSGNLFVSITFLCNSSTDLMITCWIRDHQSLSSRQQLSDLIQTDLWPFNTPNQHSILLLKEDTKYSLVEDKSWHPKQGTNPSLPSARWERYHLGWKLCACACACVCVCVCVCVEPYKTVLKEKEVCIFMIYFYICVWSLHLIHLI